MSKKTSKTEEKGKSKNTLVTVVMLALVAAVVVLLAILLLRRTPEPEAAAPSYEREVAAQLGQLENKTQEEIQAELNRVVSEGMFHIAINGRPVFEDGYSEGNLEIENVPSNRYLMRVEISLEDTGEVVYSTKYIDPDMHIQRAKLDVPLEKGTYMATATFYAYSPDSLAEMGSVASKITLYVLN